MNKQECITLSQKPIYRKLGIAKNVKDIALSLRENANPSRFAWNEYCKGQVELRKMQKRLAKKIIKIERHRYAPEMTRIVFRGGIVVDYAVEYARMYKVMNSFTSVFDIPSRLVERLQSIADVHRED